MPLFKRLKFIYLKEIRTRFYLVLFLICLLLSPAPGQIISPQRLFGRYQQFVWQDQHGLPQNGISEIVQTPDRYLWLAIAEGVVRFDGVRFTAFDTENTPEIKSNNVQSLLVDRNGTLWIGTHGGGLSRYQDGKFANFSAPEGLSAPFVKCLFADSSNNLWVGTDGSGLNLFRDGKFIVFTIADGLPDNHVNAIAEDANGNLLVGTRKGLVQFKDGQFSPYTEKGELSKSGIDRLFRDSAGNLWISGRAGLSRLNSQDFEIFSEVKDHWIGSIAEDQDKTMWFGTQEGGLFRFKDGRFDLVTTNDGLVNNDIQSIFPTPNGDLWLGTSGGGLAQLRTGRFKAFTTSDGLAGNMVGAIYEDRTGGIWIGSETGLTRFKDGKFTIIKGSDGTVFRNSNGIREDSRGNLWINSSDGDMVLKYHEGSSIVEIVQVNVFGNQSAVSLEDKAGNVWYGTSTDGLHQVRSDGTEKIFHKQDGLPDEYINALFEDSQGNLWIGTRNGLSLYRDGTLKTFAAQEGWTGKHVLSFHEESNGTLWIGTHGDGLFRFKDGKFFGFTVKNGLYDNLAHQILEDNHRNLWMSGNKGISRVNIAELEEFADGLRSSVNSFSYGSLDGMLSRECNGASPAGVRAKDGRLWFPTIKGVVVIDPNLTDQNPPRVSLEKVLIDNQALPNGAEVKVQPDQSDLEIQFSALSWNRPPQIRFKYQLVGLDENWIDSGTRRTAYYPHIPPGNYTFRVIADNGEGIWNLDGQSLEIVVLPPFYQTWWFAILCVLASALIIRLIYGYRVAQLRAINEAKTAFAQQLIENQEQERERIAVELHDSIGQSLIVIRNRALMGLSTPDKHDKLIVQMEEISNSAADSIIEVRRISHNLHPYQLEHLGLSTALETMIETAQEASPIEFEKEIGDLDELLPKEAEINLYRIVQESINNLLKHSEATKAEIKILKKEALLSVLIKDNGKGFNQELLSAKSGLGLTGIRERAKMLGAKLEINSNFNEGTIIFLQVNLSPNR